MASLPLVRDEKRLSSIWTIHLHHRGSDDDSADTLMPWLHKDCSAGSGGCPLALPKRIKGMFFATRAACYVIHGCIHGMMGHGRPVQKWMACIIIVDPCSRCMHVHQPVAHGLHMQLAANHLLTALQAGRITYIYVHIHRWDACPWVVGGRPAGSFMTI